MSARNGMMTVPVVQVGFAEHVAEIALCAGPLNLVTRELLRDLNGAIDEVATRADVRCVILHGGAGRAFCAGSDMRGFAAIRHDAGEQKILYEDMVLRNLAALPMPTIAAIDAPALGGGFELALACDLRVLRRGVTVAMPEARIGGLAANGALRLTRLVGAARAKELLFTGDSVAAEQALAWGIVNRVSDGPALDAARSLAAAIAARGPLSNRFAKRLVQAAQDLPLDAGLGMSTALQQRIFESDDLHEGVAAFFAKREPAFKGR
ncbi:MAG TPA: enoyl-CoA hydratase/isomerase family protein [Casimicrobiaceae bacterium]|nr:enoyl-CoA hydratase/isomerase family protein [Casimicrobiaceae bacterium]